MDKDEYFSRQFLKEQGFTDCLLKQLKPDFIESARKPRTLVVLG
jgi:hypothetical protein